MKEYHFKLQMKLKFLFLILLTTSLIVRAQDNLSALMPYPNHVQTQKGWFNVSANERISISSPGLQFAAEQLQQVFQHHFAQKSTIASGGKIQLKLNPALRHDE